MRTIPRAEDPRPIPFVVVAVQPAPVRRTWPFIVDPLEDRLGELDDLNKLTHRRGRRQQHRRRPETAWTTTKYEEVVREVNAAPRPAGDVATAEVKKVETTNVASCNRRCFRGRPVPRAAARGRAHRRRLTASRA
jgi:hypothetical protein